MVSIIAENSLAQSAFLKSDKVYEGDVAELFIEYRSSTPSMYSLDTTAFDDLFDVVSVQPSTQRLHDEDQVVNVMYWKVMLAPKLTGAIKIPSLKIKQAVTPELALTVLDHSSLNNNERIWVETSAVPETPRVGEGITITIKLISNKPLLGGLLNESKVKHTKAFQIGIDKSFVETIEGNQYEVLQRKMVVFAELAGELIIPSARFVGEVALKESNVKGVSTRHILRKSEAIKLTIKGQPATYKGRHWLPMPDLVFTQQWSGLDKDLVTGDSITRTLSLRATGFAAEKLPDNLFEVDANNLVVYPDRALKTRQFIDDKLIGQLDQSYAIVLTGEGTINIPAISLEWWDVDENQSKTAMLPGKVIMVTAPKRSLTDRYFNSGTVTHWLTAGLVTVALSGLLFWLMVRQKNKLVKKFRKRYLKQACLTGNSILARSLLILWGREKWPDDIIIGMSHVALKLNDEAFREELKALDKAIYSSLQSDWQGRQLWQRFVELSLPTVDNDRNTLDRLPVLYPGHL
jgi:hypothetical protein